MPAEISALDALRDIEWVETDAGRKTVRETLVEAHTLKGLDIGLDGVQFAATVRFLASVAAVVVREHEDYDPDGHFESDAVDRALDRLAGGSNVLDPERPFLQQPAGVEDRAKMEKSPQDCLVTKLELAATNANSTGFWNLLTSKSRLTAAEAVEKLVVHANYSAADNSKIGARQAKGWGFTPGMQRRLEEVSEEFWMGETLFETLCMNIPMSWVEGTGLPAWADRRREVSSLPLGEHPLWRATWTSNTAVLKWEGSEVTAACIGGVDYFPSLPRTEDTDGDDAAAAKRFQEQVKAWNGERWVDDPHHLYTVIPASVKRDGTPVPAGRREHHIPLSSTMTEVAVLWHANDVAPTLRVQGARRVIDPATGRNPSRLAVVQRLISGGVLSPQTRFSAVRLEDRAIWVPRQERAAAVRAASATILAVKRDLAKALEQVALEGLRQLGLRTFWERVATPFNDHMIHGVGGSVDPDAWQLVKRAALDSFDFVTETTRNPNRIAGIHEARSHLASNLSKTIAAPAPEKKDAAA